MTKTLKNDLSAELGNKTPKPKTLLSKGIYFDSCVKSEGQREARDLTVSLTCCFLNMTEVGVCC